MPIDIGRFEDGAGLGEPSTSERIVRFLITHEDQAYTRAELANALDVKPETVGTNLTRLKDRGLVRHREPYWAFAGDRERARKILHERDMDDLAALVSAPAGEANPGSQGPPEGSGFDGVHRSAASAFVDRIRTRLGDAIETCYLFGSVARGTESASSDVDVLVAVADEEDFETIDDQLLDAAFDVQLEYDVRIEVHSMPVGEFETRRERGEPFVRTIVEEGARCD
jgi:predicted nucleotidyltransferase/DNA-binding transcriptional ArsR family regulator